MPGKKTWSQTDRQTNKQTELSTVPYASCYAAVMGLLIVKHDLKVVVLVVLTQDIDSYIVLVFVAFDLCITLMDVGEICQLVTEARFAYGTIGRLDSVLVELSEPHLSLIHI